eukprot:COSAG05_NODE_10044_length_586_cov_1.369610_1_plen_53_part_10
MPRVSTLQRDKAENHENNRCSTDTNYDVHIVALCVLGLRLTRDHRIWVQSRRR